MKPYRTLYKEGTILVYEELLRFLNESRDMDVFSEGLNEALSKFLTRDEINSIGKKLIKN
jgi:hypothetical protein